MADLAAKTISQKTLEIMQLSVRKPGETLDWSDRVGEYPMAGGERVADSFLNERSINVGATTMVTASSLTENATAQSFSFWIYVDRLSNGSAQIIETTGNFFNCFFESSDNTIRAIFWMPDGYKEHKMAITLDEWHHVCATFDKFDGVDLYIDGVEGSTYVGGAGTASLGLDVGSHGLYLANDSSGGLNTLQGRIDEVSVFTEELLPAAVTELYNSGTPGDLHAHSSTALVHWWRMGDAIPNHGLRSTSEVTATPLRDTVQKLHFTGLGPIFTTNTP